MGRRQFGTVRRFPSGRWQARYWNGLGERVSAPETFATKGDALRWLAQVQTEQLKGTYVDPRAGRVLFADWADDWLASKPGKRAASIARDEAALRAHFKPAFGQLPLSAVTSVHIRSRRCHAQAGLVTEIDPYLCRHAGRGVQRRRRVRPHPAHAGARPTPREDPRRERPTLTTEQLFALVDEIPKRYQALVFTACVLGLRWSEVIGLRIGDVDFLTRTLHVRQTVEEVSGRVRVVPATKSDASRRSLAVPPAVTDALARHVAAFRPDAVPEDLIFLGGRGAILRRHFLPRVFKPAAERVGLPVGRRQGLDFHGLRHVGASMMVATGEHPKVMQSRLGHATANLTLELYAHVSDDVDRAAATRLEALLQGATKSQNGEGLAEGAP